MGSKLKYTEPVNINGWPLVREAKENGGGYSKLERTGSV